MMFIAIYENHHYRHARFKSSCSPAILASDGSLTALSEDQSKVILILQVQYYIICRVH